jgi:predicted nucleic acid-binding protein
MSSVLADTSVWVGHFRRASLVLGSLLENDSVLCHPLIVLELACDTPPAPRKRTLGDLKMLRQAKVATTEEVLSLIETERLYDTGCGAVDVALLASVLLTPNARLWTADRNLEALAVRLGVAFAGHHRVFLTLTRTIEGWSGIFRRTTDSRCCTSESPPVERRQHPPSKDRDRSLAFPAVARQGRAGPRASAPSFS